MTDEDKRYLPDTDCVLVGGAGNLSTFCSTGGIVSNGFQLVFEKMFSSDKLLLT